MRDDPAKTDDAEKPVGSILTGRFRGDGDLGRNGRAGTRRLVDAGTRFGEQVTA
jgi:hypothetical protein